MAFPSPRPALHLLHPKRRLAVRLGLGLCLGAAAILLVSAGWDLHRERAHLERLVGASAEGIVETIRGATRDGMLRNDVENVHRIIQNIGAQPGIDRIRIFNKEGRIRTSTRSDEVGTLVDIRAEQCIACHQQGRPLDRLDRKDRIRTFRGPSGGRVLGVIAPILNEPQCTTLCHAHPASQRVLGVLDVQLKMDAVDQSLVASERQMSVGLVATVTAVLALTGLLLWRMVLRPVHRLSEAMVRVGQGDLTARVPVRSDDEIGELGRAWNAMSEELARARNALQEWNRSLEARVDEKTQALEQAHRRMVVVEKMASLGKLAAVLAHEINNPLAGIRTYARVLRRGLAPSAEGPDLLASPPGETDRILQMMESEAARCGDIVRNMLLFSRESPARFAEEALGPVIERCLLLLRHQAELLGIALEGDVAPDLPRIVCDASQIEQLLLALVMNGLEASTAGGRVRLLARSAGEGNGVVLEVADTGCGIAPEDQARIYEPFFTTKAQGKGIGLGLAVVYGIVNRHFGRIELQSRPGATVFTVHLPERPPAEVPGKDVPS